LRGGGHGRKLLEIEIKKPLGRRPRLYIETSMRNGPILGGIGLSY
jgi:hypothetical protein